jgi:protein-S-isoprenylcysteine O-methyltransferase Ste14
MILLFLLFWGISGKLDYWEAWIYLGVVLFMIILAFVFVLRTETEFLKHRFNFKEKEKSQKSLIYYGFPLYLLVFIIPALDKRFGWTIVPLWVVLSSYILIIGGYYGIISVFKINKWASRTIEIQEKQSVISTGPYAFIRHPMYLASLFLYTGTPLALGSYWGLIGSVWYVIVIIIRLLDEERILKRDLPGYEDYCKKTRYHLIPGIF